MVRSELEEEAVGTTSPNWHIPQFILTFADHTGEMLSQITSCSCWVWTHRLWGWEWSAAGLSCWVRATLPPVVSLHSQPNLPLEQWSWERCSDSKNIWSYGVRALGTFPLNQRQAFISRFGLCHLKGRWWEIVSYVCGWNFGHFKWQRYTEFGPWEWILNSSGNF